MKEGIEDLVREYCEQIRKLDSRFVWSHQEWWKDADHAELIVLESDTGPVGFAILGAGPYADEDVSWEVCDLFCKDPWRLMELVEKIVAEIPSPWGFQVLASNHRANRVFSGILSRMGTEYTCRDGREDGMAVTKYRIVPQVPAPHDQDAVGVRR